MPFMSSTSYGSSSPSLVAAVSSPSSTALSQLSSTLVNSTFKQVSFYLAEPSSYCYILTPQSGNDDILDGEITAGQLTGLFMAMAKKEVEFEVVGFGGIELATPEEFIIKRSGAESSEKMIFHTSPLAVAQQPTLVRSPSIYSLQPIIADCESTPIISTPALIIVDDTTSRSRSPSIYSQDDLSFESMKTSSTTTTTITPSIFSQSSSESTTPSTITPTPTRDSLNCTFTSPPSSSSLAAATTTTTKEKKKKKNILSRGMRKVGKAIKKGVKKTLAAF